MTAKTESRAPRITCDCTRSVVSTRPKSSPTHQTGITGQELARDFAENLVFLEGVGHLEGMIVGDSDSFSRKWPQELLMIAREYISFSGGMVLVDASQPIPNHVVSGILDKIKNVLLDFMLDMQENAVAPEDMEFDVEKRQVVRNLFKVNIYGGQNVVAGGENVHQEATLVDVGNHKSLLNHLREQDISESDLHALKDAISSERHAPKGELGPKVGGWVGDMVTKAASGVWKVSVETASKVLMEALKSYYGW